MNLDYEKFIKDNTIAKQEQSVKCKNIALIIQILLVLIIALEFFVSLFLHVKVRDEMINDLMKRKEVEALTNTIQSLSVQVASLVAIDDIGMQIRSNLTIRENVDKKLKLKKQRSLDLIVKRDRKKYYHDLSLSMSSFLKPNQLEKAESMTKCSFISNCYRMTREGLFPLAFHRNCDGLKPTVALFKTTDGGIFGGITYESWEGNGLKYDDNAFLFSIELDIKYHIKEGKQAINASPGLMPTFGEDDLYLSEIKSYLTEPMKSYGTITSSHPSQRQLNIEEIEVYHMKCDNLKVS